MKSIDRSDLVVSCNRSNELIAGDVVIRPFTNIYNARIGAGTRIAAFVEIGGHDDHPTTIGERCSIQPYVYICPGVTIGDDVLISPQVVFTNHRHPTAVADWDGMEPVVVGDRVVIGARAVILAGVTIGNDAVIGAGAIVTKDVPAGETWVGPPARPKPVGPASPPEQGVTLFFRVVENGLTAAAISALLTIGITAESERFDDDNDSILTHDRLGYDKWKQGFDIVQGLTEG